MAGLLDWTVIIKQGFTRPQLHSLPRIVHMSSGYASLGAVSERRREQILNPDLTISDLSRLMDEFVRYMLY